MSNATRLLEAGFLLDSTIVGTVELLDEDQINFLVGLENKPAMLRSDDLRTVMEPKIRLKARHASPTMTITELSQSYNEKFVALQKALMRRVNPDTVVSAGKCSDGEATVIGLVSKVDAGIAVLEDTTGSIRAVLPQDAKKAMADEVVAVHGNAKGGILYADKLLYPDVPLKEVAKAKTPAVLLILPEVDDGLKRNAERACKKANFIVSLAGQDLTTPRSAAFLKVSGIMHASIEGVDVLLHRADYSGIAQAFGVSEEDAQLELLKRRHLGAEPCMDSEVIDPVPDIFAATSAKTFVKNYKGVTVIGLARPDAALIDLRTRDIKLVNLSE